MPDRGRGFVLQTTDDPNAGFSLTRPVFRVERLVTAGRAVANPGSHADVAKRMFNANYAIFASGRCPGGK